MFYRFRKGQLHFDVIFPEEERGIVLVYLSGFPTFPKENAFTKSCQQSGITVVMPHYYGSWLSDGQFLPDNLLATAEESLKFASQGGAIELFNLTKKKWKANSIVLGGGSFGGLVALIAGQENAIKKIFLSAPLIDITGQGRGKIKEENLMHTLEFSRRTYKNAYRGINSKNWDSFFSGKLKLTSINPDKLNNKDIFITHGINDSTININHSKKFVNKLPKSQFLKLNGVSHRIWEEINRPDLEKILDWLID